MKGGSTALVIASTTTITNLEQVYQENRDLIQSHRDLLLLLLFPMPAKQFLTKRHEAVGV